MNAAVPPTTIAVGSQCFPFASFTGKSHMSFSSCKNLAGILRQETSRSSGAIAECEADVGVLFGGCGVGGACDAISCARVATGDEINARLRMVSVAKRAQPRQRTIRGTFRPSNRTGLLTR